MLYYRLIDTSKEDPPSAIKVTNLQKDTEQLRKICFAKNLTYLMVFV